MHRNHGGRIRSAVIDRLSRQYPREVFQLVPGDRDALLSRELRQRTIELAVAPTMGVSAEGDTELEVLFDDQFVVMAGSPTKWIRRRKLVLADLFNELWVLSSSESLPGQYIAQAFRISGIEPPTRTYSRSQFRSITICCNRTLYHDASAVDVALRQTHIAQIVAG